MFIHVSRRFLRKFPVVSGFVLMNLQVSQVQAPTLMKLGEKYDVSRTRWTVHGLSWGEITPLE